MEICFLELIGLISTAEVFLLGYVVDTGYGLGKSLRDCRSALSKGQRSYWAKLGGQYLNKPMTDLGFLRAYCPNIYTVTAGLWCVGCGSGAPSSETWTSLDFCVRRAKGGAAAAGGGGFSTGGAQITAKNDLLTLHEWNLCLSIQTFQFRSCWSFTLCC